MRSPDPRIARIATIAFFALSAAIMVAAVYAATDSWGPALAAAALQALLLRIALAVTGEPSRLVLRDADNRKR